jgi:hypothetical protein
LTEEVCMFMKFSRNFTCSIIGLCVKRPLAVMSRHRLACVLIPKQKSHCNMLSGKDKSGAACINIENLTQAVPIDSSRCSKSKITLGREMIRDMGKKYKTKLVLKFIPIPIRTFYGVCVPLPRLLCKRRETMSTLVFLVSCLRCSCMNTSPQTHAGDGRGFHCIALRRVVPELWL